MIFRCGERFAAIVYAEPLNSYLFFADIAGMLPYMDGEMQYEMMYDDSAADFSFSNFRNFGWNAGLFGNMLFIDYRLEYRYFDGVFKPSFFNTSYERMRGKYIEDISAVINDTKNIVYAMFGLTIVMILTIFWSLPNQLARSAVGLMGNHGKKKKTSPKPRIE